MQSYVSYSASVYILKLYFTVVVAMGNYEI